VEEYSYSSAHPGFELDAVLQGLKPNDLEEPHGAPEGAPFQNEKPDGAFEGAPFQSKPPAAVEQARSQPRPGKIA
jgi:hypothetical protein